MIEYSLTRSSRKTLALQIKNGVLKVRAPLKMPKREIEKFITSKEQWVLDALAKSEERVQKREKFQRDYGDSILYLGNEYPIIAKEGNRISFNDAFYVPCGLTPEQIKSACIQIYRMLAKRDITNRVIEFAKLMSVNPTSVKITGAKTRWGSCSSKGSLNFSWRLIMADSDVVDYVVVHELAHLREMNHSKKFWDVVAETLPDYKERKKRLKELGSILANESWED